MVSAVFHSPLDTLVAPTAPSTENAIKNVAIDAHFTRTRGQNGTELPVKAPRSPFDWRSLWLALLPPVFGLGLLIGVWALVSISTASSIPSPTETFKQAVVIFSDPFYRKGPNDQGVGWNILMSLERVAVGFGLAAAVGIPAGFMIGRFEFLSRMFNPLISLLRPVSPLAWLPIGLLVFKEIGRAHV